MYNTNYFIKFYIFKESLIFLPNYLEKTNMIPHPTIYVEGFNRHKKNVISHPTTKKVSCFSII